MSFEQNLKGNSLQKARENFMYNLRKDAIDEIVRLKRLKHVTLKRVEKPTYSMDGEGERSGLLDDGLGSMDTELIEGFPDSSWSLEHWRILFANVDNTIKQDKLRNNLPGLRKASFLLSKCTAVETFPHEIFREETGIISKLLDLISLEANSPNQEQILDFCLA